MLKTWSVDNIRSTIDHKEISGVNLSQLKLGGQNHVDLRIGVKEDARFKGGLNLFGRKFGDYEQDLVMKIYYSV
ncbi:hypothetical protein D3C75_1283390 [compost metagenome]